MSAAYTAHQRALGQFMTPQWCAAELVDRYFGDLGRGDIVLEPSCGDGRFLHAIPTHVPAVGVEIDPALAAMAHANTGRDIIVGDFTVVPISMQPTAIVGNPPFVYSLIKSFLERAHALLPDEGRVGFLLPVTFFQTASTVARLSQEWSISQDLLPRNIYPRLQLPLCFAQFRKGLAGTLFGFALYRETDAVNSLRAAYKATLVAPSRSSWADVVLAAMHACGGEVTLDDLYREIEGRRPTTNPWWREKVRQQVQRVARRVGPARWRITDTDNLGVAA